MNSSKRKKTGCLVACLLMMLGGLAASEQSGLRYVDEVFSSFTVASDIPYGTSMGMDARHQTQTLDLYEPEKDPAPDRAAVVIMHGGSFRRGAKTNPQVVGIASSLAKRGYVVASITYRISPHNHPLFGTEIAPYLQDAQQDAMGAVRWLRENAVARKIRKDWIMIAGYSAGAAAALYVNFDSHNLPLENSCCHAEPSRVAAVLSIAGWVLDKDRIRPGAGPVALVHGTADTVVPFDYAREIERATRTAGVQVEMHAIAGGTHDPTPHTARIASWGAQFFYDRVIKGNR